MTLKFFFNVQIYKLKTVKQTLIKGQFGPDLGFF